ncbi:MAG: NOTCH2 protein, partial [Candidatus Woesebacteria bacterium GW2011_GWB1_39_12]
MSKVLAATSFTNVSFGVNVLSNFNEDANFAGNIAANGGSLTTTSASFNLLNTTATTLNIGGDATTLSVGATTGTTSVNNTLNLVGNTLTSADDLTIDPGGGGVKIGTGTQGIVDLTGDDLYVTGDLELDGSLVVGSDSVNDLTGTGLQVSSGSLQATLGTSIESSEISDSTIQEVDLNASNSPTSGYTLTYNSSTSGFTWTDLASSTTIWTDSGTTTYLTTTTDELVLGGSSPLSSAKFSIDGDTDQIQLLLQANSTQTSNVFVIENSAGSDIFSVNNDGLATWTRTSAGQWVSFDDGTDQWGLYNRAGTPEGFITANTGTLAMDTANGTLYVKTDDGDATDWVNLATGVSSPFTSSGGIIDKTTVNDRLRLQYGEATDTQFEINNTTLATAPTADAILINLTGGSGIATDGIDGIYLNLEATDITGGGTVRGLAVDLDTVGSPSGDETFVGLDIAALNTATSATEYALRIGNTWDANLVLADTTSFVKLANGGTLTIEDDSAADGVDLLTLVDAGAITIGSSATTQLVISTDSTGDTEIQLPNDSIATAEILDNTITATDLAATLTFTDGDLLDLDAINVSSNAEGIFLPQATACSSGTANGQICWDNDTFALYVGNGTGVTLIGGTGGGDITAVGNITSGDAFTSGTPGSELYFATAGFLGLGSSTGRITFTDATPDVIDIEAANLDINTNTLSGTTAVINFDDFDVDADGNVILAPDALSDALTITLPNAASRGIVVDAATNDNNLNSTTQGVINLAVDAAITAASATNNGIFVDYEALDDTDASDTFNALTIALTSTTGDADTLYGINFPDFTAGTATETGIHFGAGWNNLLEIEGTAGDGFQTFIQATAPTADRIYTLPDTTDSTFCMSSGNCAGGAGGSKWTDSGTVTYLTNTTDDLVVGASAVTGAGEKISFQGDEDEILLLLQGNATQTSNIILVEQDGGTDLFTLSNSGLLSTSDLTLGLNDTSATISTNDTDEDLTLDPNGNGNITLTAPTVTLSGTTTLTASSLATFTTAATLGMASTSTLNCADCIDWDDIKDATTLDTATTIASIVTATSLDLNVSPAGTAASPIAFEITPTWGIDVTDQTLIGLNINPATNSNTDPDDVLYGIQLADITATAGTETAVRIGAAYDNLFEIEGTAGDGFQTFIRTSAPTADRIYTLPDTTDSTFCMSSGNCAGGAGGSKWTDDGAVTYLTSQTDNLAVGGTDSTSEFFIDIANGGTLTLNSTGDTENIFDINANSLTTGSGIDVSSTATAFNGELLVLNKTGASGSTSFTSDITNITYSQTFSSTGTSNTGNVIDISRSYTIDDGTVGAISGTVSGAVATFSDNCAVGTADTCTNTANILSLTQNYASATGAIIEITNAGTGADISLDNDATITNTTNGDISLAEN